MESLATLRFSTSHHRHHLETNRGNFREKKPQDPTAIIDWLQQQEHPDDETFPLLVRKVSELIEPGIVSMEVH